MKHKESRDDFATERSRVLETTLQRQLAWIAAANGRFTVLSGLAIAMLGVLAAVAPSAPASWRVVDVIVTLVASALLFSSILFAALAFVPRTKGSESSMLYFGGIAARSLGDFRDRVQTYDEDSYMADLIEQVHINARIAAQKNAWVQRSMVTILISTLPWAASIFLLYGS